MNLCNHKYISYYVHTVDMKLNNWNIGTANNVGDMFNGWRKF